GIYDAHKECQDVLRNIDMVHARKPLYSMLGPEDRDGSTAKARIDQQFTRYLALGEDPPDANFRQLAPLTTDRSVEPVDNDPVVNALWQVGDNLRFASATALALLHSMERYQGAAEADDVEWALIHGRAIRDNLARLREQEGGTRVALAALRDALLGDPRDFE